MPSLGIRFDIEKLEKHDSSIYARPAWEIVFRTFGVRNFEGETDLFEGDTNGTISGREYVYCLAIQNNNPALLKRIRDALDKSQEFNAVANATRFVEGGALSSEPLVPAAHIDSKGDFEIKPGSCLRLVLAKLRKEDRVESTGDVEIVKRARPASKRSANLPQIKTLDDLESLLLKTFSHQDAHPDIYFFLTPEELCDLVERYEGVFRAYWEEKSDDEIKITITEPFENKEEVQTLKFRGLCAFASNADALGYCRKEEFNPLRWGIQGAIATNFQGSHGNWLGSYDYEKFKTLHVTTEELWKKICERRQQLGVLAQESKKWWQFWK